MSARTGAKSGRRQLRMTGGQGRLTLRFKVGGSPADGTSRDRTTQAPGLPDWQAARDRQRHAKTTQVASQAFHGLARQVLDRRRPRRALAGLPHRRHVLGRSWVGTTRCQSGRDGRQEHHHRLAVSRRSATRRTRSEQTTQDRRPVRRPHRRAPRLSPIAGRARSGLVMRPLRRTDQPLSSRDCTERKQVIALDHEADLGAYARAVGSRLRSVRNQMHMSLQMVADLSEHEFRTSVLGAYERGDRAIPLPRLQRLATLYDVPVEHFLPHDDVTDEDSSIAEGSRRSPSRANPSDAKGKVTIDLARLERIDGPEGVVLHRYLASIQAQRQNFQGPTITIRAQDLHIIASLMGVTPDHMNHRLDELGLRP